MAAELNVVGLMNVQYAIKDDALYIIEVNPRASRTIPFVSKATGVPLAKLATKIMLGKTLADLELTAEVVPSHLSVKEAVLPFDRFPDVDTLLGPEMKSTGEVMGIGNDFGLAYAKAQLGAGQKLPLSGTVFISVGDEDKAAILPVARQFADMGFTLLATDGTWSRLDANGIPAQRINKVSQGRPHAADAIKNGRIQLIVNTGTGQAPRRDGYTIRRAALKFKVPYATTTAGALAVCRAVAALREKPFVVKPIQDYHG
jgi:carbamoyl-phosphate synthase large subunit